MASADGRYDLLCSICLDPFTDLVSLTCGHKLCRVCNDHVLDTQEESGVFPCPKCRAGFQEQPTAIQNMSLQVTLQSPRPHQEEICCTYCIHSPVPAVKSCLHCEASLCDDHLKIHNKSEEHVLTEPSTSMENRKCSVHKELLKYYCTNDAVIICVSCSLAGKHRGHQVEMLDEASEKKKEKLKNVHVKLITEREKTEEKAKSVEERCRKAQKKAAGETNRVNALFTDIRRRLDDVEKKVLSEISRKEKLASQSLSEVFQKLEMKKNELSKKMRHIEELCNMTDPLTVLQEPDTGDLCDPEEGGGDEDTGGHDQTHEVDVDVITEMIHTGLTNIVTHLHTVAPLKPKRKRPRSPSVQFPPTKVLTMSGTENGGDGVIVRNGGAGEEVMAAGEGRVYVEGPADILLDVNTASDNILISEDRKTATGTLQKQNRQETAKRFQKYQVMSSRGFTSGRHYWDVEISGMGKVGMCYPSIDRRGRQSYIGHNNKSWCLCREQEGNTKYLVIHDGKEIQLPHQISSDRFRIYLNYEDKQLTFYELCDPIRHLHTFTTTFTEPLHAVLYVWRGYIKVL